MSAVFVSHIAVVAFEIIQLMNCRCGAYILSNTHVCIKGKLFWNAILDFRRTKIGKIKVLFAK